jgi:hypothetical protein
MVRRARIQVLSVGERAALCFMFLASVVATLVALPGPSPVQATPVAIVYPPWTTGTEAVARSIAAGHLVLRSGRLAFIVIAAATGDAKAAPTHRPQGAILVLALAGLVGCLDARVTEATPT